MKQIILYALPLLLIVSGILDFFKLEPAKTEMEAMNLGGIKMIVVGIIDWILAIGIIFSITRPYALIAVLFLSFGALVAHIVSGQMGKFFVTTLLPFVLAGLNLYLNYYINIVKK
jgi:uncharacterized membrane protein YphA (DoxX/SURF4 family)